MFCNKLLYSRGTIENAHLNVAVQFVERSRAFVLHLQPRQARSLTAVAAALVPTRDPAHGQEVVHGRVGKGELRAHATCATCKIIMAERKNERGK